MSDIVVAIKDGILTGPDGIKHRLVRGKTLAHASHPAVALNPRAFAPMVIHIVDEAAAAPEVDAEATQIAGELHDARAEADGYRDQLAALAELVVARGLPEHFGITPDHQGWLVEVVEHALDETDQGAPRDEGDVSRETSPEVEPEPITPPRGARKSATPRKPA
jgi:hypothetical protein